MNTVEVKLSKNAKTIIVIVFVLSIFLNLVTLPWLAYLLSLAR